MSDQISASNSGRLEEKYNGWYDQGIAHWEFAPGKKVLLNALKICCDATKSLKMLDIGCGTGSFLARIQEDLSDAWEYHGIDFSKSAIEAGQNQFPKFHLLCDDASKLSYEDSTFDVVICYGSWEHFSDPVSAIAEAARVLKPGGWLLAMIPTLGIHRTDREDEGWYEDTAVAGVEYKQMQWNYRRKTWAQMFEQAGVQLVNDSLAESCGARKAGVFYFGVKLNQSYHTNNDEKTTSSFKDSLLSLGELASLVAQTLETDVLRASALVKTCLDQGHKVLACGNGGSAADAQHFVAELVGHMAKERRALPAITLNVDPSIVTALGNDYGYNHVFSRQIEGLGQQGDVLIVLSTSGRSPNVLEAVSKAKELGLHIIALIGQDGDPILEQCDICLHIPSSNGQRIQELHTVVLHSICAYVETSLD